MTEIVKFVQQHKLEELSVGVQRFMFKKLDCLWQEPEDKEETLKHPDRYNNRLTGEVVVPMLSKKLFIDGRTGRITYEEIKAKENDVLSMSREYLTSLGAKTIERTDFVKLAEDKLKLKQKVVLTKYSEDSFFASVIKPTDYSGEKNVFGRVNYYYVDGLLIPEKEIILWRNPNIGAVNDEIDIKRMDIIEAINFESGEIDLLNNKYGGKSYSIDQRSQGKVEIIDNNKNELRITSDKLRESRFPILIKPKFVLDEMTIR